MVSKRVLISGKVQGVGYRYGTREQARSLGLVGWVRNLADGRVEAVVVGDRKSVDAMLQWFQQGPPAAKVDKVEVEEQLTPSFTQFEIQR